MYSDASIVSLSTFSVGISAIYLQMRRMVKKSVFEVCNQVGHTPGCTATEGE